MTEPSPHPAAVPDLTDEDLLSRFHRGDRSALSVLAARYEASLLGLARGLSCGREDLALDIVQEAWLRVIRYGRSFDRRSTFRTWIYRIVINRCHDLRSKAGTPERPYEAYEDPPPAHDTVELNGRLKRAVGDLSQGQQLVVLLCYHRDLTHEQVAEILAIPVGTVKSRLHAALESLRTTLSSEVRP